MVPFEPDPLPDLTGTSVFIGAGRADSMAPPAQAEHLADLLRRAGAAVTLHWEPGGHAVTEGEVDAARDRKSTRLNSSHSQISYAVFCLKKKITSGSKITRAIYNGVIQAP